MFSTEVAKNDFSQNSLSEAVGNSRFRPRLHFTRMAPSKVTGDEHRPRRPHVHSGCLRGRSARVHLVPTINSQGRVRRPRSRRAAARFKIVAEELEGISQRRLCPGLTAKTSTSKVGPQRKKIYVDGTDHDDERPRRRSRISRFKTNREHRQSQPRTNNLGPKKKGRRTNRSRAGCFEIQFSAEYFVNLLSAVENKLPRTCPFCQPARCKIASIFTCSGDRTNIPSSPPPSVPLPSPHCHDHHASVWQFHCCSFPRTADRRKRLNTELPAHTFPSSSL